MIELLALMIPIALGVLCLTTKTEDTPDEPAVWS